jgi:hypothetical protein
MTAPSTKEEWLAVLDMCYNDPLTGDWTSLSRRVYFALTHSGVFLQLSGAWSPAHALVGAVVATIQEGGVLADVAPKLPTTVLEEYQTHVTALEPLVAALIERGD